MASRPPTWMFVALGLQLALSLAGLAAIVGLGNAMAGHAIAFAHDDVPMLFPAASVLLLGGIALALWRPDHRTLSTVLTIVPLPVAAALMAWAWW